MRTLNAAELAGLAAVDQARALAVRGVQQAEQRLAQLEAERKRIYEALDLDADKSYEINGKTGEVKESTE